LISVELDFGVKSRSKSKMVLSAIE